MGSYTRGLLELRNRNLEQRTVAPHKLLEQRTKATHADFVATVLTQARSG